MVVFDFGGVVARADTDSMKNFLMQSFKINPQELSCAFLDMQKSITDGRSEKQFWEQYATQRGVTLPKDWLEQFGSLIQRSITLIPQTVSIVEELKEQGYQVALHSDMTQYQAEIIGKMGYFDLFDPVILSYQIGVMKTDPCAFEILLATLHMPASCVIFIDDRKENVENAKTLGIDAIHFVSPIQLKEELASRNVLLFHRP